MDFTYILGYVGAMVMGFTLGLMGGGGSILSVPILVYIFGIPPVLATAYSLFIVGLTALFGAVKNMMDGNVSYRTALTFAVPSFIAVFITRKFIIPAIPDQIFTMGDFVFTKDLAMMIFFALIMLAAAFSMLRKKKRLTKKEVKALHLIYNYPIVILDGLLVGFLTGLVGAGGGFLIIPALVLLVRLPMKIAIGTSLLIISVKSLIGFLGDVSNQVIDWQFLLSFSGIAIIGLLLGTYAGSKISNEKLKRSFGWFILVMAIFILVTELFLK